MAESCHGPEPASRAAHLQLLRRAWQPQVVLVGQHGLARKPEHPGHPEATHVHPPLWQLKPLAQAKPEPHPPQLFLSVCSLTQAPLQEV